ncbi:MAG TPA: hypothetical protein PLO51_02195 [Candidatus Micrarchaeota archaeon]|nr:hypothetical protein [Candidatus Micrarchaeota archaeon]
MNLKKALESEQAKARELEEIIRHQAAIRNKALETEPEIRKLNARIGRLEEYIHFLKLRLAGRKGKTNPGKPVAGHGRQDSQRDSQNQVQSNKTLATHNMDEDKGSGIDIEGIVNDYRREKHARD